MKKIKNLVEETMFEGPDFLDFVKKHKKECHFFWQCYTFVECTQKKYSKNGKYPFSRKYKTTNSNCLSKRMVIFAFVLIVCFGKRWNKNIFQRSAIR